MACDRDTTLAAACTSGIGKLRSKIQLLQAWAQLLCTGFAPPGAASLILDDGINPPTIIFNPVGVYDLSGEAWVSVTAINATGITSLIFSNNLPLTSLSITGSPALPNLTVINTSIVALDLSNQTEFNVLIIESNALMTSVDLSALNHTDDDLTIDDNAALTTINLGSLVYVSGDIAMADNVALVNLSLPMESFSGGLDLTGCTLLETLDISVLTSQGSGGVGLTMDCTDNANLETITWPADWPFVDSFTVDLSGCGLDQTTVDFCLEKADAAAVALTASTIDVSGGTSAAPTVGTGLTAAFALIAAGNTVLYNTVAVAAASLVTYNSVSTVATAFTTGAYTPTANALVLAFVYTTSAPVISSVTGNGLTWKLVNRSSTAAGGLRVAVYRSMGASPTNTGLSVNISAPSAAGIIIHVQEYTGVNTGGTNGSAAIVQAIPAFANTVTIAPFNTNSLNSTVGAIVTSNNPTGASLEGSWTQDVNQAQTPSGAIGAFVAHRLATTDNSFTSGVAANVACLSIEIMSAYSQAYVTQPSAIANLVTWCRSDTGLFQDAAKTTPCTNGTAVYVWDNMGNSGALPDFIQATLARRPLLDTAGTNGLPKVVFNTSRLEQTLATAQPWTAFIVGKYTSLTTTTGPWIADGDTNPQAAEISTQTDGKAQMFAGTGTIIGTVALNGLPGLLNFYFDAANSIFFLNNFLSIGPGSIGTTGLTAPVLGDYTSAPGNYLNADYYEVMVWSRQLTKAEQAQVQIYAQNRYAIAYEV